MPYRIAEQVETVRFPVRTPPLYRVVLSCVALLLPLSAGFTFFGYGALSPAFVFLAVLFMVFIIAFWATTEPYRIGGNRGEIVIDGDTLSVPGHRRGEVVRMRLSGISFTRVPMMVSLSIGSFTRGEVVVLRNGLTMHAISTLTSADPEFVDKLFAVLTERSMPAPEREKLDALMQQAARLFDEHALRTRVGAPRSREDDEELERRIDQELMSEKE
jgi:hypothetical protein